jgi:hypothetical protein
VLSDGDGNPALISDGSNKNMVIGGTEANDDSPNLGVQIHHGGGSGSYMNIGHTSSAGNGYSFVRFFHNSSKIGDITQNGTSQVLYLTSSDHRLKENVDYTWDATTRLKQLKPARFNFIADADTTVDGFLAHEAQAVVPECVTGAKDAVDADGNAVMQGIDQSKLVPLLVKAIQEQQTLIESLTDRIAALEG